MTIATLPKTVTLPTQELAELQRQNRRYESKIGAIGSPWGYTLRLVCVMPSRQFSKITLESKSLTSITLMKMVMYLVNLDSDRSQLKLKNLVAIASSQYPTPAIRPPFPILNTGKVSQKFGMNISKRVFEKFLAG